MEVPLDEIANDTSDELSIAVQFKVVVGEGLAVAHAIDGDRHVEKHSVNPVFVDDEVVVVEPLDEVGLELHERLKVEAQGDGIEAE